MRKFCTLPVAKVNQETPDCVSVELDVPTEYKSDFLNYQPGQHLTFKKELGGVEVRRNYSLCTSPQEKRLKVAVKKVAGGAFSTYVNHELQVGDTLDTLPPMGSFYVDIQPSNSRQILAVAAGSGITPVISNIKAVLEAEKESSVTLLYGNKDKKAIIFREELNHLKNKYMHRLSVHHVLSREKTDRGGFEGHIDAEKITCWNGKLFDLKAIDQVLICGPGKMIENVKATLVSSGVSKGKIHTEWFGVPGQNNKENNPTPKQNKNNKSRIRVVVDGIEYDFGYDGQESLLDAAMKQGADLPFACKGGVCCTCKARLTKGEVSMDVNYGLEPDEIKAGYILTCQARPLTSEVTVDFDAR
jgi:ring-1,2-phenylacetyl-CoA epoxidase subunit PaaE